MVDDFFGIVRDGCFWIIGFYLGDKDRVYIFLKVSEEEVFDFYFMKLYFFVFIVVMEY